MMLAAGGKRALKPRWSPEEKDQLAAFYHQQGPRACAQMLGRTLEATKGKAKRLGLTQSRWKDWPTGRVTDIPLRDAIVGVMADIRNRERVPGYALDSLKQAIYHNHTPNLATIIETAGLLCIDLHVREDWETFAALVAERLPSREDAE